MAETVGVGPTRSESVLGLAPATSRYPKGMYMSMVSVSVLGSAARALVGFGRPVEVVGLGAKPH